MQSLIFLSILLFAVLAGAAGALTALRWRRPGMPRIFAGLALSALAFLILLLIQFAVLRALGDSRADVEISRAALILLAACSIFWGPAFVVTYWYYSIDRDAVRRSAKS